MKNLTSGLRAVFIGAVLMTLLFSGALVADPVNPADFTGSRNSGAGGGITATGPWADGGFVLSWMITDNGNGTFTYVYTITGPGGAALTSELSHWILELSQGVDWTGVFDGAAGVVDLEITTFSENQGNPGLPGPFYGVKLNYDGVGTLTLEFTTTQAPIWGNFYAKDGGGTGADSVHAFNTGFGTDPTGCDPCTDFIARPDTITTVPEPGSLLLLGSGLLGLALAGRTLKRRLDR